MSLPSTNILSVKVCTLSAERIKLYTKSSVAERRRLNIFTPNSQMLLAARKDAKLSALLNSSSLNIPDGTGVRLAAKIQKKPPLAQISGIDLAEYLLAIAAKRGWRVFLLGGKRGVAKLAQKNIKRRFPKLDICGIHHGYFEKHGTENAEVIAKINSARPDLLFVCFGFPMQEKWLRDNAGSLSGVSLAMGLGGAIDVWSGRIARAPHALQKAGLEWLWRTLLEPKRAKIFLDIPKFLFAVLKEARANTQ